RLPPAPSLPHDLIQDCLALRPAFRAAAIRDQIRPFPIRPAWRLAALVKGGVARDLARASRPRELSDESRIALGVVELDDVSGRKSEEAHHGPGPPRVLCRAHR